jgi:hypothetical protein
LGEKILGVVKVGLLLVMAESCAAFGLCLLFLRFLVLGALAGSIGLVFGDALSLCLFIGGGLGGELGLGFGSLALLFALYFRVFGGIPRVEDLVESAREVRCP